MDRRKTFEGLVLRALNIQCQVIARYAGPKTDKILAEWKEDARAFLKEPWIPDEREIVAAEIVEYHERTAERARKDGNL